MYRHQALLCLALAGCISAPGGNQAKLKVGTWIEAKGRMVNGKPIVDEIDELERTGKSTGLITLCAANGLGTATIIERV